MKLLEHLEQRGMNPTLYDHHVDDVEGVVCFYLYNFAKDFVGYQQYRPNADKKNKNHPTDGKYFTYLKNDKDGFFGLEYQNDSNVYFVVEGIFKAAKLHSLGYQAVAVLGNNPKRLKSLLRVLKRKYKLVAVGDNDSAGSKLVNVVGYGGQSPADLDEMSDKDVHEFVAQFL